MINVLKLDNYRCSWLGLENGRGQVRQVTKTLAVNPCEVQDQTWTRS